MMVFTIAMRELRSLFLSPLAWAILVAVQVILAYFFLLYLDYFAQVQAQLNAVPGAPGITDIVAAPLFASTAVVLLIVVPLLTMRLISEERRSQTLSLLFSAPVSMTEIIIGKYLGVMGFLGVILLLVCLMPLSLALGATLDYGMLFAGLLGLVLVIASFAAIGLYVSTLTAQPTVAAVTSFGALLLLWILDFASNSGQSSELFSYISMLSHYQPMLQGLVNSSDLIYYGLFVGLFLVLSIRRLDADRLQH